MPMSGAGCFFAAMIGAAIGVPLFMAVIVLAVLT